MEKTFNMTQIADGIYSIETHYLGYEGLACCYLIEDNGELAFFETNTNHAVPYLLEAVNQLGYKPEDVKYVILSHIHLDHAGGTGLLMQKLPNAQLVVHARGRKHMINPEKLIEGVKAVYGEEKYHEYYGDILPIDKNRVIAIKDYGEISLGSRTLTLTDSPGHAKHHMFAYDAKTGSVFSGDAFGIGYPRFELGEYRLVFPSTSPIQFEPDRALETYQKIVDLKPKRVLLTHFSNIEDISGAHEQLKQWIAYSVEIAENRWSEGYRDDALADILLKDLEARFGSIVRDARGSELTEAEWEFLFLDRDLNAKGIAHYIKKKKESEESATENPA